MVHGSRFVIQERTGQALLEAIIAGSVLTVGFLGLLALLARSLSVNRVVADNYVGTYLAGEGIEVVKNMIDANILQGRPWNSGLRDGAYEVEYNSRSLTPSRDRFLSFDPVSNLYGYGASRETSYTRAVSLSLIGADEISVNSLVSWTTRGGGNFQINLEDHFFNWRP